MFPHIFYGAFQGLDNVLYKAFTLFRQGIYKVFQCFLQGLYKVFNVVLQGFYNAVARLPQVVYNACYKFFTRRLQICLQGFYSVLYWIRSSLWRPRNRLELFSMAAVLFALLDLFPTWDTYQKIPSKTHQAAKLHLYLFLESSQGVEWGCSVPCHSILCPAFRLEIWNFVGKDRWHFGRAVKAAAC